MMALILLSAGFAYFLSLPFASVIQGGGYRLSLFGRAKKALLACGIYLIIGVAGEVFLLLYTSGILSFVINLVVYLATGAFVIFIYRSMRISMHFTRRLIRLLIAFVFLYIALFIGLYFVSFHSVWAVTPAVAPFLLAGTACLLSPFERMNNRRYIKRASDRILQSAALKIAVTGSYGKTSVRHYLEILFSRKYATLVTPENYNTPLGIAKTAQFMTGKEEVLVLEMGARRRGDIAELCEMTRPDIGVITGIAPQHLETFHSLEEIIAEKNVLAENIPSEQCVFYNLTDPIVRQMYDKREGNKIGVGYERADYLISEENFGAGGSSFILSKKETKLHIDIPCAGKACVINFALAAAVALECGVAEKEVVAAAGRAFAPVHRFEVVRRGEVTVIDDSYNINPIGAKSALASLFQFAGERKIVYTSGMVEMGKEEERYNTELGKEIAKVASVAIVCEGRYGDAVVRGIEGKTEVLRVRDTREASELFGKMLKKGDVLLIMSDLPRDYLL